MGKYSLEELRVLFSRDAKRLLVTPDLDYLLDIPKKKRTRSQKRKIKELKELRKNCNRHIKEGQSNLPLNHKLRTSLDTFVNVSCVSDD